MFFKCLEATRVMLLRQGSWVFACVGSNNSGHSEKSCENVCDYWDGSSKAGNLVYICAEPNNREHPTEKCENV